MSTQSPITAGALTPFYIVARAAGLETWALQKLLPEGFLGNPEFVDLSQSVTHLTPAGILELSKAVDKRGYAVMSHSLRVLARDRAQTPSRSLIAPAPKDEPVVHAWQQRKDCA